LARNDTAGDKMDQAGNLRSMLDFRKLNNMHPMPGKARVITVTSGKGGVGKTNFTINLALYLHKQGARVVVVDADLGLANIEILLGATPEHNLMALIKGTRTLEEVITRLPHGIGFISGGSGLAELANLSGDTLRLMVEKLGKLDEVADIVLIDTGAGISNVVLQFVMAASEIIVVCAPEPTSITDAYVLIKAAKERKEDALPDFRIVINRADSKKEGETIFNNLRKVSERFLSVKLSHLGSIPYDPNLIKAVKQQTPCIESFPHTIFSKEITQMGNQILDVKMEASPAGMKGFMKRLVKVFGN
jgi:flagellar biosynthesis protein FlhG